MHKFLTSGTAFFLLLTMIVFTRADQQVVFSKSAMPRIDMHTHMDAKTQYAKCVKDMDIWSGTITISLAGIFWVKDNDGNNASPASVRQIPGNDMVYVKDTLNNRILFIPGAFTIPKNGIWWSVNEIKTFKSQGFAGLKWWPHGKILTSAIPLVHEHLIEAGRQGMPIVALHVGDGGTTTADNAVFPQYEDNAVMVVKQHPQTQVIFAHGIFMMNSDQNMIKLGKIFDENPNVFVDLALVQKQRQPARFTVSRARDFYIKYRDRILFGSDVFAAGNNTNANGFLEERKLLETDQMASARSGAVMQGLNLPDSVLNHIYYWNTARLVPRVRAVLEARGFRIGFELGKFKFDRLPPDVTVNKLKVDKTVSDLTGTLGSITDSLVVEIAGQVYPGVDNKNGTWTLPGKKIAGLPAGTYDVKVTAKNSIGLVRTDTTTNELTVIAPVSVPFVRRDQGHLIEVDKVSRNQFSVFFPYRNNYTLTVSNSCGSRESSFTGRGPNKIHLDFSGHASGLKMVAINFGGTTVIRKILLME